MSLTVNNALTTLVFEIPDPPKQFGQDGGKFYRAYDALAEEIDEDTAKSLKEQLDGMLIFAGLFAGVNSAFLALTLPLLSPDPSDDTNVLLIQNNAILMQLVLGRNETVSGNPTPSTSFSPSRNIFVINALFALSLTFAIISSFLSVLGRQWLVYYRKRSGGGPDRQRWEQLKRFLGAQRWRLELILDDVLPSLLQTGLAMFCASLVIYLHRLSPAISTIVGIPMCIGLATLVGSAMCTLWDRFCPFHSPLSHLLCWIFDYVPSIMGVIKGTVASLFKSLPKLALQFVRGLVGVARQVYCCSRQEDDAVDSLHINPAGGVGWLKFRDLATVLSGTGKRWLRSLTKGREEESMEFLQAVAIARTICTSDDPATLLYATANILSITSVGQMEQLWSDETFQERLVDQLQGSDTRMLQFPGRNRADLAMSVKRLHCATIAHVALFLDESWDSLSDLHVYVYKAREDVILVPDQQVSDFPAHLFQATVGVTILQFCLYRATRKKIPSILSRLVSYSNCMEPEDWRLFCVISWVASMLPAILDTTDYPIDPLGDCLIDPLRKAYRGYVDEAIQTVEKAFGVLSQPEYRDIVDCNCLLTNLLRYINQMVTTDMKEAGITMEHKFTLLARCELVIRGHPLPEVSLEMARKARESLAGFWEREYLNSLSRHRLPVRMGHILIEYLEHLRIIYKSGDTSHEGVEVLRTFGLPLCRLLSRGPDLWVVRGLAYKIRVNLRSAFNNLVAEIDGVSRRNQPGARPVRDPDLRFCHWYEKTPSILAIYYLEPDPPESGWNHI